MTDLRSAKANPVRIAYLDCVGGLSGDMFVGALLDAGWPEESFRRGAAWLQDEISELRIETRSRHTLAGKGIVVVPRTDSHEHHPGESPGHSDHPNLATVLARVRSAPLPAPVIERAGAVFASLAAAEARAHGVAVEQVHFHEVGAVDALIDVCSACLGLHDLGIEQLHVSTMPMSPGLIDGSHGRIPLPAPAAAYLLESAPVRWIESPGERCTPTGAALAAALGTWAPPPAMRITRVGCGAGERDFADVPNIVRLFLGEQLRADEVRLSSEAPDWGWSHDETASPGIWHEIRVLTTQIDDATPEALADLAAQLQRTGALEVLSEPVVMKKGRLGTRLVVLARPGDEAVLASAILRNSTTLGLRWSREWRRELVRREIMVPTRYGDIRFKLAWRGNQWTGKPEYESCRAAANAAQVPIDNIRQAAREGFSSLAPTLPPYDCSNESGAC